MVAEHRMSLTGVLEDGVGLVRGQFTRRVSIAVGSSSGSDCRKWWRARWRLPLEIGGGEQVEPWDPSWEVVEGRIR